MTGTSSIDINKVIRQVQSKAGSKGLIGFRELATFFPPEASIDETYALIEKLSQLGIKVKHETDYSTSPTAPRSSRNHALLSREQEVALARQIRHGHKRRLRAAFRCPMTVKSVISAASKVNRGERKLWEILSDFEGTKVEEEESQAKQTLLEVADSLKRLQTELSRLCSPQAKRKNKPSRSRRIASIRGSMTRALGKLDFHEKFLTQLIKPIRAEASRIQYALSNLADINRELGLKSDSSKLTIQDADSVIRSKMRLAGLRGKELEKAKRLSKKSRRTIKSASVRTGLSTEELQEIAKELRLADKEADQARHKLVESNQRLVMSIARRYPHHSMDFLDLVQEGNLGLMRAADRFDPDRGFRFGTYAAWWVRQSIGRLVAEQGAAVRIPPHVQESLHKLNRITRRIVLKTGKEPSLEELAQYIGKPPERVAEILTAGIRPVSTDAHVGDGDNTATFIDFLSDPDAVPDEEADLRVQHAVLQDAMSALSEREQDIISLRFQDGLTLQEVGDKYGITRERTRQIQEQALQKLRKRLKADLLRRMVNSPGRG